MVCLVVEQDTIENVSIPSKDQYQIFKIIFLTNSWIKRYVLTNINCGKTQVLIQIRQIGTKLSSLLFITRANTHALAQRVAAILKKTKTNPKCILSDDTILHGPSFKNFASPSDPEKTEMANVI